MKIIQKTLELIKQMLLVAVIVLIIFGPIKYGPILIKHIYSYIVRPPVSAEDYLIRGDKYFNEGKKTEALKDYNKAFELDLSYSDKYEHSVSQIKVIALKYSPPTDVKTIDGLLNPTNKKNKYKTKSGITKIDMELYNILNGHMKKSDITNMNSYARTTYPFYGLLKVLRIF